MVFLFYLFFNCKDLVYISFLLCVNNKCKSEVFIGVTRQCENGVLFYLSLSHTHMHAHTGNGLECYYDEVNSSALCISWPWGESVSLSSSVWMNPKHLMQPLLCDTWNYIAHTHTLIYCHKPWHRTYGELRMNHNRHTSLFLSHSLQNHLRWRRVCAFYELKMRFLITAWPGVY